jgi:hypothetical protein
MIISASRRTDIPALYMPWLLRRLEEGHALVRNPFNPRQVSRIDLRPEAVDILVLWTRDPAAALPALPRIEALGHRFLLLVTCTGYPEVLEPQAPRAPEVIAACRAIGERFGRERLAWRYDPILFSDLTPPSWHLERFASLCRGFAPCVDRVIISFADFYRSVRRALTALSRRHGIRFTDPHDHPEQSRALAARLAAVAREHGLRLQSCAEKLDLDPKLVPPGACIDPGQISRILGRPFTAPKDPHQRRLCRCAASRDLGAYDTCTHGCAYCYANHGIERATANRRRHDPENPALLP